MPVLELVTVVLGAAAAWLLVHDGSIARRRLAALWAPATSRRGNHRRWRARLTRCGAVCLPSLGLAPLLGPVTGLVVGVPVGCALGWWLYRRGTRPIVVARSTASLPIAVDLMAAGVRAGGTIHDVLAAVTPAVGGALGRSLEGVAERLRLGAEPATAWYGPHAPTELSAVGQALARASDTGAPVADLLDRHAAEARERERTRAYAATQRLGVLAVAPLGLCFLPAFVLIGIVPLAAGLISGLELP